MTQSMTDKRREQSATVRMSVNEAARRLGVCRQTVRNLAHGGKLQWFWGGGSIRPSGVVARSVEDFMGNR